MIEHVRTREQMGLVVALHQELWATYSKTPKPDAPDYLMAQLEAQRMMAWISDGAAFATAQVICSPHDAANVLQGVNLYVRPEHRRNGHGEALTAYLITLGCNFARVQFEVRSENDPAIALYVKLGMKVVDKKVAMTS